jgi:hypothetical protein
MASRNQISILQLKNESFGGWPDDVVPGYNQKVAQFCRQFGKFRPDLFPSATPPA